MVGGCFVVVDDDVVVVLVSVLVVSMTLLLLFFFCRVLRVDPTSDRPRGESETGRQTDLDHWYTLEDTI